MTRSLFRAAALLVVALLTFSSTSAYAASGDPITNTESFIDTSFGTKTYNNADTDPASGKWSEYSDCGSGGSHTEGASAYRVASAPEGTRLSVAITEEADQPICRVEVFQETVSGNDLNDLYDPNERDDHLVDPMEGSSACPQTVGTNEPCEILWRLPATDAYFVVVWPHGDGSPNQSTFDLSASVLERTTTTIAILESFAKNGSCFRVKEGAYIKLRGRVTPSSSGDMRFTMRKRDEAGDYGDPIATSIKSVVSGIAEKWYSPSYGRYKFRVTYLGNLSKAWSTSTDACVDVVTPSFVNTKLSRYYTTSGDYGVYHGGSTIVVTATVGPAPAAGTMRFIVERQISNGSYIPYATYTRTVTNGKAVLSFIIQYRSSGLPFYHVSAEYLGDFAHFPKTSIDRCVWIRP